MLIAWLGDAPYTSNVFACPACFLHVILHWHHPFSHNVLSASCCSLGKSCADSACSSASAAMLAHQGLSADFPGISQATAEDVADDVATVRQLSDVVLLYLIRYS